ncbi:TonB family protein [Pedobacter nototheniae]|uniref:TonB family protein n=1 Tax=Pedobacter nototheniae TaxID=2488994 RepID=UPI00292F5EEE|nr:TonB family protein [Pedobacter nototheniae]
MKKIICLIALCWGICNLALAQQDTTTIYETPKGYLVDPLRSKWIMKKEKQDSLWVVRLSNKKGVLQEKVSFADEALSIRKGPFERYEKGVLLEEGYYEMGYKTGTWSKYYTNKQLKEKVGYKWDKADGPIVTYWDNKQLKTEGEFKLGKKVGHWKIYFRDGKFALSETYNDNGELLESAYSDADGNRLNAPMILTLTDFSFLKKMKYPPNAILNKIQGKVLLEFSIVPNGSPEDIKVFSSPDDELSQEAISAFKMMTWNPNEEIGTPVKTRFTISINFTMN